MNVKKKNVTTKHPNPNMKNAKNVFDSKALVGQLPALPNTLSILENGSISGCDDSVPIILIGSKANPKDPSPLLKRLTPESRRRWS